MNKWTLLAAAIASEVTATLSLRASVDEPAWYILVALGYGFAFYCLGKALATGLPLGVAYGIWAAAGVAATAILAVPLFDESFSLTMGLGLVVLIAGVLLVEIGHHRATHDPTADTTTNPEVTR